MQITTRIPNERQPPQPAPLWLMCLFVPTYQSNSLSW